MLETYLKALQYNFYLHGLGPSRLVQITFFQNNFSSFVDHKFDLLYSKRAFVHWYVGEGMEEVNSHLRQRITLIQSRLTGRVFGGKRRPGGIRERLRRSIFLSAACRFEF